MSHKCFKYKISHIAVTLHKWVALLAQVRRRSRFVYLLLAGMAINLHHNFLKMYFSAPFINMLHLSTRRKNLHVMNETGGN